MENGHLILTFPDVGLKHLESSGDFKELMITIIYFKSLIRCVCVCACVCVCGGGVGWGGGQCHSSTL